MIDSILSHKIDLACTYETPTGGGIVVYDQNGKMIKDTSKALTSSNDSIDNIEELESDLAQQRENNTDVSNADNQAIYTRQSDR